MGAGPWVAGTPIALQLHGDHSFVLARSFGIMVMQGGFALLEAGSVHIANRGNIMMKNLADMSFCMVFFLLYGYSLGLAEGNSFIGGGGSVGLRNADAIEYTAFFYHFSFATTTGSWKPICSSAAFSCAPSVHNESITADARHLPYSSPQAHNLGRTPRRHSRWARAC